jgi:hypothetical protein
VASPCQEKPRPFWECAAGVFAVKSLRPLSSLLAM